MNIDAQKNYMKLVTAIVDHPRKCRIIVDYPIDTPSLELLASEMRAIGYVVNYSIDEVEPLLYFNYYLVDIAA
jgi:hypothetical protein